MDGLGKMVNEMIQKRMQDQYAKWNSDDPEDRKKIRDEHLQQAYDRIAAALPDDQISELKNLRFSRCGRRSHGSRKRSFFLPAWDWGWTSAEKSFPKTIECFGDD